MRSAFSQSSANRNPLGGKANVNKQKKLNIYSAVWWNYSIGKGFLNDNAWGIIWLIILISGPW